MAEETVENFRYREAHRVTVAGALVNVVLAVAKIIIGFVGHSQSLIADGIHSLSDLASDALVLFAAKHASRDPDEDHPYGHGRIETIVTVALGVLLILVAAGLGVDAVRRLFSPELLFVPEVSTLFVAALSVIAKEALYWYTIKVARRIRSNLLRANAWHHRSDAVSSIVVVIGVAGTMAGLPYLDAVAAVGVAFMIAKIGWELGWSSIHELIDTALEADRVEEIRDAILSVDGVAALHMLRTRRMGGEALVDVHILVNPSVSVSEGHQIGETVRHKLLDEIEDVRDVTVHIDPEDDEIKATCEGLPLREEVLNQLKDEWRNVPEAAHIDRVTLHYLDGKVHAEIVVPLSTVTDLAGARELSRNLIGASKRLREMGDIQVYFS